MIDTFRAWERLQTSDFLSSVEGASCVVGCFAAEVTRSSTLGIDLHSSFQLQVALILLEVYDALNVYCLYAPMFVQDNCEEKHKFIVCLILFSTSL